VYVGKVMVNAELMRGGYAESFAFAPNTLHKDLFDQLEHEARDAHRGQWGPLEGGPPYGAP
jgi:micrococcal nuclease